MTQISTKALRGSRTRPALLALGIILAAASPAMAKTKTKTPVNRGLESVNQPVVQHTEFVFDATPDGYNSLSHSERERILDWFDAIELGYGDRVSIANDGLYGNRKGGVSVAVAELVGRYGLLMAEDTPRTAGEAPSGAVRIVVSRSTASVPGCPNWSNRFEADLQGGLSSEYGCAINGNLAAMVADPEDLVRGRQTHSILRGATASRAVKALTGSNPK